VTRSEVQIGGSFYMIVSPYVRRGSGRPERRNWEICVCWCQLGYTECGDRNSSTTRSSVLGNLRPGDLPPLHAGHMCVHLGEPVRAVMFPDVAMVIIQVVRTEHVADAFPLAGAILLPLERKDRHDVWGMEDLVMAVSWVSARRMGVPVERRPSGGLGAKWRAIYGNGEHGSPCLPPPPPPPPPLLLLLG